MIFKYHKLKINFFLCRIGNYNAIIDAIKEESPDFIFPEKFKKLAGEFFSMVLSTISSVSLAQSAPIKIPYKIAPV